MPKYDFYERDKDGKTTDATIAHHKIKTTYLQMIRRGPGIFLNKIKQDVDVDLDLDSKENE